VLPNLAVPSQAAPLRGAGSGAPRAGLWPWRGPARNDRAVPAGAAAWSRGRNQTGQTGRCVQPSFHFRLSRSQSPRQGCRWRPWRDRLRQAVTWHREGMDTVSVAEIHRVAGQGRRGALGEVRARAAVQYGDS